jgi:DNA-binding response OmpR family regulator
VAEKDRILVIDSDEDERTTLVEAVLESFGYDTRQAADGSAGLAMALEDPPDLIILSLDLDIMTGKDVMAALAAQGVDAPVIVITGQRQETTIIQAFRLGARDYLSRPLRDAEVIAATERVLKDVRVQRDRRNMQEEIRRANRELERHIQQLQTLAAIGKQVAAMTNLEQLFERVAQASVVLTQADSGGFLLREDEGESLILQGGHNLDRQLLDLVGRRMKDDLAKLVMSSGETFLASGEGLKRLHPVQEAQSVIYAPLMVQGNPLGVLWVAKTRQSFEEHQKDLMTALADYVAIAIANARLFGAMAQRSDQLEEMYRQAQEAAPDTVTPPFAEEPTAGGSRIDAQAIRRMREALYDLRGDVTLLQAGDMGELAYAQQATVDVMARKLGQVIAFLDELAPPADHA